MSARPLSRRLAELCLSLVIEIEAPAFAVLFDIRLTKENFASFAGSTRRARGRGSTPPVQMAFVESEGLISIELRGHCSDNTARQAYRVDIAPSKPTASSIAAYAHNVDDAVSFRPHRAPSLPQLPQPPHILFKPPPHLPLLLLRPLPDLEPVERRTADPLLLPLLEPLGRGLRVRNLRRRAPLPGAGEHRDEAVCVRHAALRLEPRRRARRARVVPREEGVEELLYGVARGVRQGLVGFVAF